MEIITRKQARENGSKTYFTGAPCINGHVTYRYTQSGSCSGCIRANNIAVVDPNLAERKAAKELLVQVKLRAYVKDRPTVAAAAYASVACRYPVLTMADVDPNLLPTGQAGGTALYRFNVHPDDLPGLYAIANSLLTSSGQTPAQMRAAIYGKLLDEAEKGDGSEPPMNFR